MKQSAGLLAGVFLGLALTAPDASGECPLNQGQIGVLQNCASPQSTAAIFSTSGSNCVNGDGWVSYDLITGTIDVTSWSASHEGFTTWMQASDDFVIEGPPSATPIGIAAICTVELPNVNRAQLQLGSGVASVLTSFAGPTYQTLRLDLEKLPGEHFTVSMRATGSALLNTVSVRGTLRFTSLPTGYTLTSCQGYAALPVATRATSWGRLKQFYR